MDDLEVGQRSFAVLDREVSLTEPPAGPGVLPFKESLEIKEFDRYIDEGIKEAYQLTDERFGPGSENPLIFHDRRHPRLVVDRIRRIYRVIMSKLTPNMENAALYRQARLTELIGAWHDTVQNWNPKPGTEIGTIQLERQRERGPNEEASANELVGYMKKVNEEAAKAEQGKVIFTEEDMKTGYEGVMGTFPEYVPATGTLVQVRITDESRLPTIIMGLADFGAGAMDGPEQLATEGNYEFQELWKGITDKIAAGDIKSLTAEEKQYIAAALIKWIGKDQISFNQGRANVFPEELARIKTSKDLANFPPQVLNELIDELRGTVFNKYPDSLALIRERADRANLIKPDQLDDTSFHKIITLSGYKTAASTVKPQGEEEKVAA